MHILLKTLTGCRSQLQNGSIISTQLNSERLETQILKFLLYKNLHRQRIARRRKKMGAERKGEAIGLRPLACRWCWRRTLRLRQGWRWCPHPPGWRSSTRSGTASSDPRFVFLSLLLPGCSSGQQPSPPLLRCCLILLAAETESETDGKGISTRLGQKWGTGHLSFEWLTCGSHRCGAHMSVPNCRGSHSGRGPIPASPVDVVCPQVVQHLTNLFFIEFLFYFFTILQKPATEC